VGSIHDVIIVETKPGILAGRDNASFADHTTKISKRSELDPFFTFSF
jgi:hypothetical protein